MKKSEKGESLLLQLLKEMDQGETLDSVVQSLRQELGEDVPTADAVEALSEAVHLTVNSVKKSIWLVYSARDSSPTDGLSLLRSRSQTAKNFSLCPTKCFC